MMEHPAIYPFTIGLGISMRLPLDLIEAGQSLVSQQRIQGFGISSRLARPADGKDGISFPLQHEHSLRCDQTRHFKPLHGTVQSRQITTSAVRSCILDPVVEMKDVPCDSGSTHPLIQGRSEQSV